MDRQNKSLVRAFAELEFEDNAEQKAFPSTEALQRIKKDTLKKVQAIEKTKRLPVFKSIRKYIAAAAVVAVIATSWIGPSEVWAGLQRALSLVPGFGLVEQQDTGFTLLAAQRPRVEHQNGYVEVSGLLARQKETTLSLYIYGIPQLTFFSETKTEAPEASYNQRREFIRQLYLIDERGREYRLSERTIFSWAGGGSSAHIAVTLPPLDEDVRQVGLVLPLYDNTEIRIDVPLVALSEIEDWESVAHTNTRHGVSVSGAATFGSDTRVSLFVLPPNPSVARIESLGGYFGEGKAVTLSGSSGKQYELERRGQTMQNNYYELYFEAINPADKELTLNLPVILFREEGKARATVPVPAAGEIAKLNTTVDLGRFKLALTGAEVVSYPDEKVLRVYVDLGPQDTETFESFSLGIKNGGWGSKYDEITGQMEYFEVTLSGNARQVRFDFINPVYSVKGPWTVSFPVE